VIDDQDLGIHAAGHPFVKTNGKYGLTDRDVAKAIRLFERTAREVTNEPNRT
jgi:phage terminase Nu1 subunit (DNA packaging protein)